jgi:hypothetical protein
MSMEKTPPYIPLSALDEYNLRETLEAAQEELVNLMKEREQTEWRISKLQTDIVHLAALCRVEVEDPIRQLGLTDAVRWIFATNRDKCLSVREVVIELQKSWAESSTYKNIHANVHTVFRRLRKAGDIKPCPEMPRLPSLPYPEQTLSEKISDDEDKYTWGGGLPPLPPRLREISKK